jgi:Ca2+-transporting ATPase
MLWIGLLISGLALSTSAWVDTRNLLYWQTMVFSTLVTSQLFQALALRSERDALFTIGLFTNRYMMGTVVATLAAQIAVIYLPIFNDLIHTTPLQIRDLLFCLALGSAVLPIIEWHKYWSGRREHHA